MDDKVVKSPKSNLGSDIMFGIENYNPTFYCTINEFIESNGKKLKNVIGKQIEYTMVMWEENDNEWDSDGVVVICVEGYNIEICNKNLNELSVTINEINFSSDLEAYDFEKFGKFKFEWRKDALEVLNNINGRIIKDIELIEYKFESKIKYNENDTNELGKKQTTYLLNGIGLNLDDGYISVFNSGDTNGISNDRDSNRNRYIRL
ncbi:MAG: hypothetical protein K0S41_1477 [Anaerocolumna sp.]|jgi:hypothetical protein|nr:hypothetical protein [Anaerocolumna sp.]